jgi:hypothetical protein
MARIDPAHEKLRLTELYSQMSDGELLKVFGDLESLTDIAYDSLQAEIAKRKLETPQPANPSPEFELGDFVMVRRFRDLPEAMMAKGGLESAGIDSHLIDENMVRMDWFWSNLLGGVKLYVRAEEAEAAQQILGEDAPESYEVEGVGEFERPRCPQCNSIEIAFEELNKPVAFASAYLNVPIPLHRTGWLCHSCGHRWSEKAEETEA